MRRAIRPVRPASRTPAPRWSLTPVTEVTSWDVAVARRLSQMLIAGTLAGAVLRTVLQLR